MLRVRLIGGLAVDVDGESREAPQSRRGKSLLAWLALNPGVHSRSKVAAVFWPDVLDQSARASLRVALSELRKALGPGASCLVAKRDAIGLRAEGEIWVDLAELDRLAERGRLAEAVELGQGELLPELDDEWVLEARDRHRERMAELLGRLASEAQAEGDARAAVRWSRRRAEFDPLSEEAAAQLIRLLAAAGDHAAAMAAYERLRERLATTLGIVPSPKTRELVAELRAQAELAPVAAAAGPPAPEPSPAVAPGALVTLLFTDLVGSTEFAQALGDSQAEAMMGEHFDSLRDVLRERGGRELKQLGDGLMVAFPSAAEAVGCAAGMQRAVARSNRLHPDRPPLSMRVGVHAGEVSADGGDVSGTPVVVAKRLCDAAAGGQVLVSNLVRELAGTRASERFLELGELELKGLSGRVAVSELSWEAPARPTVLPGLVAASDQRPFVGREEALESLEGVRSEVRAGNRRLATLAGEPGIGKTRLAARFASLAHEQGMLVLFGRCFEETLAPYQAFVEALDPYLRSLSERELETALGAKAEELARLFPELRPGAAPARREPVAEAEGSRLRLFDAVVALLSTAARPDGVLLVLDDLHWADQPTLLLLGHLLHSPEELPLLLLATYRDSELRPGHPLEALLSDLAREQPPERLRLAGLSEPQVRGLVALADAPEEVAPSLHAHTGGNPLFVIELLREREGRGAAEVAHGAAASAELNGLAVPDSIKGLIRRRLARLGEPSERLLRLAAVAGVEFEFDLLERLSDLSGEPLADALDEAVAARLIEEDPDAFERFHFAHPLIREALYEDTSRTRRRLLHRRVGEGLEALHVDALESYAAELAHHYFEAARGGDLEKAIEWAIRAGEAATGKLAYEQAAAHYERALGLVGGDEPRRCDLLLALGESRWFAGDYKLARAVFREAGELAERLELAEALAQAALGFGGRIGFDVGVPNPILNSLLERALELLADDETALRARVMARLSEALAISPERERAIRLAERAVETARQLGDNEVLAEVLVKGYWARANPDNLDEQLAILAEAEQLAEEAGATRALAEAVALQIGPQLGRGDIEAADAVASRFRSLSVEQIQAPYAFWWSALYDAARAFLDRPLDEVEWLVRRAVDMGGTSENPSALELFAAQIGLLRLYQGRIAEARAGAEQLVDYARQIPAFRCGLARFYCELGRDEDARRELERLAVNDFAELPRDVFWFSGMELLADVCNYLGDEKRAATLHKLLVPYADRYLVLATWVVPQGSTRRQLGLLATTMSRFEEAEAHFETALERDQEIGSPYAVAKARCDYASMLLTRAGSGDNERAAELLGEALEVAERLGAEGIAERARALRREAVGETADRLRVTRRQALRERASALRGEAKAAVSTGGRSALARLVGDMSDEELARRFGSPLAQRALLAAMARSFQPRLAFGFEGEIAFELTGSAGARPAQEPDWWTISVEGKRAVSRQGRARDPALTVHADIPTLIRLIAGEDSVFGALLEDRVQVEGDLVVGSRLVEMFGGVSPAEILGPLGDPQAAERSASPPPVDSG